MYVPAHFALTGRDAILDLVRQYSFATLVTVDDGVPVATHLPFMLDPDRGEQGTLIAHLARANSQWRTFTGDREALVIFQGPHAYISPSWYETHPSVPTWNYIAVHAYGIPSLIDDEQRVRSLLNDLVGQHEPVDSGWTLESAEAYVARMLPAIVAFEMPITRLEAKAKLSQNRDATDRANVAAALADADGPLQQAVAEAMRAREQEQGP